MIAVCGHRPTLFDSAMSRYVTDRQTDGRTDRQGEVHTAATGDDDDDDVNDLQIKFKLSNSRRREEIIITELSTLRVHFTMFETG